ncbi:MAG: LysM peptidoglycan-binding domain-containing protein [Desulfobacteraceae bacterium]|nr:LysM peptidoglycan-binding domain-containing protein [Desulfobacteraceae bacterium]
MYTVKAGDYLGRIARLHQMNVSELKKVNNMRRSVIYPGEKLKVNPILSRGAKSAQNGPLETYKSQTEVRHSKLNVGTPVATNIFFGHFAVSRSRISWHFRAASRAL